MDIFSIFLQLCRGLGVTLAIFAITVVVSIPLGLLCSLLSRSKYKVVRGIVSVYVPVSYTHLSSVTTL